MGQKISDLVATTGALIAAATTVLFEVVVDGVSKKVAKAELEIAIRNAATAARIVDLNATSLSITQALHDGRTIKARHTAATSTLTLPAATGSGAKFRIKVGAVNTNSHIIKVANSSDTIKGLITILDNDSNAVTGYCGSGTDDTITLNGTTTGGQIGDWVELEDILANVWAVSGQVVCPAGSDVADMFSATV